MPLVPVSTTYTASAIDLLDVELSCLACGARSKASVLTTAYATVMGGPLGIDSKENSEHAANLAESGLGTEAKSLALLARCPRCGARDAGEIRRSWIHHGIIGAFLGALSGFVGFPFSALLGVPVWLPAAILFPLVTLLYTWRKVRERCARADRFVERKSSVDDPGTPYRATGET